MDARRARGYGVLVGMLLMVSANGLHWFITPADLEASTIRKVAVVAQVLVAAALALWVWRRAGDA
ncbi:MAG: hypothetical protein ACREM1_15625 [Longimicrobiales bacterium]